MRFAAGPAFALMLAFSLLLHGLVLFRSGPTEEKPASGRSPSSGAAPVLSLSGTELAVSFAAFRDAMPQASLSGKASAADTAAADTAPEPASAAAEKTAPERPPASAARTARLPSATSPPASPASRTATGRGLQKSAVSSGKAASSARALSVRSGGEPGLRVSAAQAALPEDALSDGVRTAPASSRTGAPSREGGTPRRAAFGAVDGPGFLRVPAPRYPRMARRRGLEGEVLLELTLGADGRLLSVSVMESAGHGFDEAALEAVRRARFRPAVRNGRPEACRVLLPVHFRLRNPS